MKKNMILPELEVAYERLAEVFECLAKGGGRGWSVNPRTGERTQIVAGLLPGDEYLRLAREEDDSAEDFIRDAVPLAELARRLCRVAEWAGIEKRRARRLVARLAFDALATCERHRGRVEGAEVAELTKLAAEAHLAAAAAETAKARAEKEDVKAEMYRARGREEEAKAARERAEEERKEEAAKRREAEIALAILKAREEERNRKAKGTRGRNIPRNVKSTVLKFLDEEFGGDVKGEGGWQAAWGTFTRSPRYYTAEFRKHCDSPTRFQEIAEAARKEKARVARIGGQRK